MVVVVVVVVVVVKVMLTTSIAEASLTIPDALVVIDTGKVYFISCSSSNSR